MKQIVGNRFVQSYQFSNSVEQEAFIERISASRTLSMGESDGQNPISIVIRNSLTNDAEFVLSFRSDNNEDTLNVVFWDDRIIFDSGSMVYFLTHEFVIQTSLKVTTPLVGFYFISRDKLLILEEAFMRVVDKVGRVQKSETLDLISRVVFQNKRLVVCTESGDRIIDIC